MGPGTSQTIVALPAHAGLTPAQQLPPQAVRRAWAPQSHVIPGQAAAGQRRQLGRALFQQAQHALSGVLGPVAGVRTPRTFHCPFCLENVREEDRVVFADCGEVAHGVCRECMGGYVRDLIADGRVNRIGCHLCGGKASTEEVMSLTDAETFAKYNRFREMRQDPTVRECPKCSQLCRPEVDEEQNVVAEMTCRNCGQEFCYYHSNAHENRPCAEYRRELAAQERLNERGALRGTKPCPECGIVTEKTGGCNHMTCQHCSADWCWTCGAKLRNGQAAIYEHYHEGGGGCRQFDDFDPRSPLAHLLKCLAIPVRLLSVVLFLILSLTLLVWLPAAFIWIAAAYRCKMKHDSTEEVILLAVNLAFVPFVAVQLCWIPCSLLIWVVLRPCGAECGHLIYFMQVPFVSVLPFFAGVLWLLARVLVPDAHQDYVLGSADEEAGDDGEEAAEPGSSSSDSSSSE